MNQHVTSLYLAITDNRAVVFATNLSSFIEQFKLLEPTIKSYGYYYKEFAKGDTVMFKNANGIVYYLQRAL